MMKNWYGFMDNLVIWRLKMIKLQCLTDICPITNDPVDMRKCCNKPTCEFYGAVAWSEAGEVTCLHPQAEQSSPEDQKERWDFIKKTAGMQHLNLIF